MAKLKKLLDQGIQPYRNFMIVNRGKQDEYYIDPLHERNGEMVKITPIAENMFFIFYICPNCCEVHSESKKVLNVDNKEYTTRCPHMPFVYKIQFDMPKDKMFEREESLYGTTYYDILEGEYDTLKNFEK